MYRQEVLKCVLSLFCAVSALQCPANAITVPFVEQFSSNAANWYDATSAAPVSWISAGGPDGSSFVSSSFNFSGQTPGLPIPNNAVNLFRAQDEFNSSNHAFEGNWIAAGATEFNFWVRHNAPSPMTFFARFAPANNFPAWAGVQFTPIAPNVWTQVSLSLQFGNPNLFFEGPPPTQAQFDQVFSNIGHVQIGTFGGALAGVDQLVTFDLDQVAVIPAPGTLMLFACAMVRPSRRRFS